MKKEYSKPAMQVIAIETEAILAMSFGPGGVYLEDEYVNDDSDSWSGSW